MGRARVWLQREVKLLGTPFDGIAPITGPGTDTGTPVAGVGSVVSLTDQVGGLAPAQKFHWASSNRDELPVLPALALDDDAGEHGNGDGLPDTLVRAAPALTWGGRRELDELEGARRLR